MPTAIGWSRAAGAIARTPMGSASTTEAPRYMPSSPKAKVIGAPAKPEAHSPEARSAHRTGGVERQGAKSSTTESSGRTLGAPTAARHRIGPGERGRPTVHRSELPGDGRCCLRRVTGQLDDLDTHLVQPVDRCVAHLALCADERESGGDSTVELR